MLNRLLSTGDLSEKQERWSVEIEEIQPELEMAQGSEEETAEKLQSAEEAMQEWQQQWDDFNQKALEPRQKAEVQQSRIQHIEQLLQRVQQRIEKLEEEKSTLTAGPVEEDIELLSEQLAEAELFAEEQQQKLDDQSEQINMHREKNTSLGDELDKARNELQSKRGRHASLEALQQAALGQQQGAISDWLSSNGLDSQARLAEGLKVTAGWEKAVETVLGENLQAVCVDGIDAVAELAEKLEQGSITLLDNGSAVFTGSDIAETLASKIESGQQAQGLLAGIYTAADLSSALALRSKLAANESVVTAEGLWMGSNWPSRSRSD